MTRRLAAILAADVASYSALMAENEQGTLEALRRLRRELLHPAVAGHQGRVIKSMGDGWLVEFGSAANAVKCALRVQSGLTTDTTIRLRVGIHLGDIAHEDEDIFGDGVNIASRLEGLAEPGSIVISDAVHCILDGTLTPAFDNVGWRTLKNIPRPVQIWVAGAKCRAAAATSPLNSGGLPSSFPVLAIHPVETSDKRPEVQELAAALTSDLFNYLDKCRWLSAIVAEEPPEGTWVLTCRLRARGDRLRLEAGATDRNGTLLWSRRVDGSLDDSFGMQDSAGAEIASGLLGLLTAVEKDRVLAVPAESMDAESCLLGAMLISSPSLNDILDAIGLIKRAMERAPDWGLPYAYGVHLIWNYCAAGFAGHMGSYPSLLPAWTEKAAELLDPDSPYQLVVACARNWQREDRLMLRAVRNAVLRRHPFDYIALASGMAGSLSLGEPQVAIDCANRMLLFNAETAWGAVPWAIKAIASVMRGRDRVAVEHALHSLELSPHYVTAHIAHAAACAHLGRPNDAARSMALALRELPGQTSQSVRQTRRWAVTAETERFFEGLCLAGLPDETTGGTTSYETQPLRPH